jgi:hypothetical protein
MHTPKDEMIRRFPAALANLQRQHLSSELDLILEMAADYYHRILYNTPCQAVLSSGQHCKLLIGHEGQHEV